MKRKNELYAFICLILLVFLYAVARVKYYEHSHLILVTAKDGVGQATVGWHVGEGAHNRVATFKPVALRDIAISMAHDSDDSQTEEQVWIEQITGELHGTLDLELLAREQNLLSERVLGRPIIKLTRAAPLLKLRQQDSKFSITFRTYKDSGQAVIALDGAPQPPIRLRALPSTSQTASVIVRNEFDECLGEKCAAAARLRLSALPIKRILIKTDQGRDLSQVILIGPNKTTEFTPNRLPNGLYDFEVVDSGNQVFNSVLFTSQAVWALLVSCVIFTLWRHFPRGVSAFTGTRKFFWIFLIIFLTPSTVYWLYYWPITFHPDSSYTWHSAYRLDFQEDLHPFLNAFYVLFLLQAWNHPAMVSLFQILATSGLAAFIFYYLIAQGVNRYVVYLCAGLFATSVPVALLSSTLWRDVPFSLLGLFWAFFLAVLVNNRDLAQRIKTAEMVLLVSSVVFFLVRHNGLIPLVVIPSLVLALRLLPYRKSFIFAVSVAAGFYVTQHLVRRDILEISKEYPTTAVPGLRGSFWKGDLSRRAVETGLQYFKILDIRNPTEIFPPWRESCGSGGGYGEVVKGDGYSYHLDPDVSFFKIQPVVPGLQSIVESVTSRSYGTPLVYLQWDPRFLLYLFIPPLLCFWWLPRSAVFSIVILSQTLGLYFLVNVATWRYYYYQYLACFFILPLILLDITKSGSLRAQKIRGWTVVSVLLVVISAHFASVRLAG